MSNPCLTWVWFFGARNSILICSTALSNLVIGVIVGGIWRFQNLLNRVMMEVYNIISWKHSISRGVIVLTSIGAGFWIWFCHEVATTWIGIAYDSYPNHALPWLRIQPCFSNLGTPTPLKSIVKNIMPWYICCVSNDLDVAKLHLLWPSFPFFGCL